MFWIIFLFFVILVIIILCRDNLEHYSNEYSNEAVQNLSSVYNDGIVITRSIKTNDINPLENNVSIRGETIIDGDLSADSISANNITDKSKSYGYLYSNEDASVRFVVNDNIVQHYLTTAPFGLNKNFKQKSSGILQYIGDDTKLFLINASVISSLPAETTSIRSYGLSIMINNEIIKPSNVIVSTKSDMVETSLQTFFLLKKNDTVNIHTSNVIDVYRFSITAIQID